MTPFQVAPARLHANSRRFVARVGAAHARSLDRATAAAYIRTLYPGCHMVRLFFRFIGWLLLAAGFVTLLINGTQSIAANRVILSSFGETSQKFAPQYLALAQSALHASQWAFLGNPVLAFLLMVPTFVILLILGSILVLATGKRAKPIGFSSRP
ncbi:MAG: hypothetical protein KGQ46_01300 [Hyphomicrobiales bacterium]|nr:hypothetical protein [Hyphomicrobiales bacterium]MDE2115530.1 hypothetical protein [Hyphomicrobiales bacterium]